MEEADEDNDEEGNCIIGELKQRTGSRDVALLKGSWSTSKCVSSSVRVEGSSSCLLILERRIVHQRLAELRAPYSFSSSEHRPSHTPKPPPDH